MDFLNPSADKAKDSNAKSSKESAGREHGRKNGKPASGARGQDGTEDGSAAKAPADTGTRAYETPIPAAAAAAPSAAAGASSSPASDLHSRADAHAHARAKDNKPVHAHAHEKPDRRLASRFWMASGFPFSLHQLLPMLEAVGTTNKWIARVCDLRVCVCVCVHVSGCV